MNQPQWLQELREAVTEYSMVPTMETMPRNTLADKGIAGPTSAHRIEEIHTPLNFAYITLTTGSTAFQNIVGVTAAELPARVQAGKNALHGCGLQSGEHLLVTYPPLVNVFSKEALQGVGISWSFLDVSSRDALILALCERQPRAVLGESSFLRVTLESMKKMNRLDALPQNLVLITAGTPLDLELLPIAEEIGAAVHDLYGCQEFGWLALDGVPLREDISLLPAEDGTAVDFVVGGLPTGDRFAQNAAGHICNSAGNIITYSRRRSTPELEVTVLQAQAQTRETLERLARTILRIKAKIVRIAPDCVLAADTTRLSLAPYGAAKGATVEGAATALFDSLLAAQMQYQAKSKQDGAWSKER